MIRFENNLMRVLDAMDDAVNGALAEVAGELVSRTKRNIDMEHRVDTGRTKNSWRYRINRSKHEATIGSNYKNAIWDEMGTGEYAVNNDGRKGGWWIKVGFGGISKKKAEKYGWAKVVRDKDGNLKYVFTYGKKPTRAFFNAYTSYKNALIRTIEARIGRTMGWND